MSEDATTQMANYDLYTELDLDKDMPPTEIAALLDGKINDFRSRGYSEHSPEVDQLTTARAILGDPYKRDVYESALYGRDDDVVDVVWLHNLADTTFPPTPAATGADPAHEPSATTASPSSFSSSRDNSPSAAETREVPFFADGQLLTGSGSEENAAPQEETTTSGAAPAADLTPASDTTGTPDAAAEPDTGAPAHAADSGNPWAAGAAGAAGSGFRTSQNEYGNGQYGGFGQQNATGGQDAAPGYGQQIPSSQNPTPATATSVNLTVAGRTRSQSKAYLACLAIMVLGMIYPLIVLFTGDNDADGVYSILKASMFTVAHAVAWVGIAEVIWGVRRIAYPARDDDNK